MRFFRRAGLVVSLLTLFGVGLYAAFQAPHYAHAKAPALYTVSTAETAIPNTPDSAGNLQLDVLCEAGDVAIGGGHIIHPSSTKDMFPTKSYATNAAGDFAPPNPDRWRVKVINSTNHVGTRLTVHAVCARGGDIR